MGAQEMLQKLDDQGIYQTPEEMRGKIMALEAAIRTQPGSIDQSGIDSLTHHHFAPGVYMRELYIPKGTLLTGMIHKTEHLNIFAGGDLSVWTDHGMRRLVSYEIILSKPGIKRVGYAHEDSVWITVHPNVKDEKDVKALEDMLVTNDFAELDAPIEAVKLIQEGA